MVHWDNFGFDATSKIYSTDSHSYLYWWRNLGQKLTRPWHLISSVIKKYNYN